MMFLVFKDSQIVVPATTVLPKAFHKLGNDSYKLVALKMKWDEARRQCQADDADLASILNPVTQAYVTLQISKHNEPVWIGLNSNEVKGSTSYCLPLVQTGFQTETVWLCFNLNASCCFFTDWWAVQVDR